MPLLRSLLAGGGIAVALSLVLATPATAAAPANDSPGAVAPAGWPPECGSSVCFWSENAFSGHTWNWDTAHGYRDLPDFLHDHVGSFVARADACFINWGSNPSERRTALSGDWRSSYLGDFGARMDAVTPGKC